MNQLRTRIAEIGCAMVACNRSCEGVYSDRAQGIIPRGLVLESASRDAAAPGAIFLGMNPGKGDDLERAIFRADPSFAASLAFIEQQRLYRHLYYLRLRALADGCGLGGPLLWTELAKCQSAPGIRRSLPRETYRCCAPNFLLREVAVAPADWPIFTVGRDAYRAAKPLFEKRTLIGLAHPTGSWPRYSMFAGQVLKAEVRCAVSAILSDRRQAWVPEELRASAAAG